jgi:hypothetical protein
LIGNLDPTNKYNDNPIYKHAKSRLGQASWLGKQIDEELDEVKCAMICEALGEAVSSYHIFIT